MAVKTTFTVNQVDIHQGPGYGFFNIVRPGPGIPVINDGNIPPSITDPSYLGWSASHSCNVGDSVLDSNSNIEICVAAGTSGSTVPSWPTTIGTKTTDGSGTPVTWQMRGRAISPTWVTATSYLQDDQLRDSNSNVQLCIVAGTSGSTQPTWATALGSITVDGSAQWLNLGPTLPFGAGEGAINCDIEGKIELIGMDQETAPIASVMTAESASISAEFKQLNTQLLTYGVPHATYFPGASTALPAGAQTIGELGTGGLIVIPNLTIVILSPRRSFANPAKFYEFILQKAAAKGSKPGLGFTRTKTSMWKGEWEGLAVESWPNGFRVARLIEQT